MDGVKVMRLGSNLNHYVPDPAIKFGERVEESAKILKEPTQVRSPF
jgi:hypothetical protein